MFSGNGGFAYTSGSRSVRTDRGAMRLTWDLFSAAVAVCGSGVPGGGDQVTSCRVGCAVWERGERGERGEEVERGEGVK